MLPHKFLKAFCNLCCLLQIVWSYGDSSFCGQYFSYIISCRPSGKYSARLCAIRTIGNTIKKCRIIQKYDTYWSCCPHCNRSALACAGETDGEPCSKDTCYSALSKETKVSVTVENGCHILIELCFQNALNVCEDVRRRCLNGGTCSMTGHTTYTCKCTSGFTGENCSETITVTSRAKSTTVLSTASSTTNLRPRTESSEVTTLHTSKSNSGDASDTDTQLSYILILGCGVILSFIVIVILAFCLYRKVKKNKTKKGREERQQSQHPPWENLDDIYHIYDEALNINDEPQERQETATARSVPNILRAPFPETKSASEHRCPTELREGIDALDDTEGYLTVTHDENESRLGTTRSNQENRSGAETDAEGYLIIVHANKDSVQLGGTGESEAIGACKDPAEHHYDVLNRDALYGNTDKHMYEMIEKTKKKANKK